MNRRAFAIAGIVLLGAAAAVGSAAPAPAGGAGSALGGFRVVVADALFLRAERLRMEGRFDEVRSTYQQILDLDPSSEDAADFLASVEARDLRPMAPTDEARVRWWRAAMDLIEGGLKANPRSARLHWRMGDMLIAVPDMDPAVAKVLATAGRDRELEGLRHLLEAARITDSIPRLSRLHLENLARWAPRVAAERYAKGAPGREIDEALAIGNEALRIRGDALLAFSLDPEDVVLAGPKLQAGLNVVLRVGMNLRAKPPQKAKAKEFVDAYVQVFGVDRVAAALSPLVKD